MQVYSTPYKKHILIFTNQQDSKTAIIDILIFRLSELKKGMNSAMKSLIPMLETKDRIRHSNYLHPSVNHNEIFEPTLADSHALQGVELQSKKHTNHYPKS